MTDTLTPVPMDPMVRDLWTSALRSGEYEQVTGSLRGRVSYAEDADPTKVGYCCLGVLCDIAPAELGTWDERHNYVSHETNPENSWDGKSYPVSMDAAMPPQRIADWSGVSWDHTTFGEISRDEDFGESTDGLFANMNDSAGATFEQIADLIDGLPVVIGDTTYQYDTEESAVRAANASAYTANHNEVDDDELPEAA